MAFVRVSTCNTRAIVHATPNEGKAKQARGAVVMSAQQLWALDFDGVICDSCGESALSAWKAAEKLWPSVFTSEEAVAKKGDIMEEMRSVRPVVETGYENIIQVRALLEGTTGKEMLDHWEQMLPEKMQEWSLDREEMVELFGSTRDDWMATDLDGWLAPNRIYDGVAEAMKDAMASPDAEVFIVTTKQERFTKTILERMAGIDFPLERIFSMTVSGKPKTGVLKQLAADHPGATAHFVEDKLATLQKVEADGGLDDYNLYLVNWGYNTESEKQYARDSERIELISSARFGELLHN